MQRQYDFIQSETAKGSIVMAYDRKAVPGRAHRLKDMERVSLLDGVLYVDGKSAMGWTFASVRRAEAWRSIAQPG